MNLASILVVTAAAAFSLQAQAASHAGAPMKASDPAAKASAPAKAASAAAKKKAAPAADKK